MTAQEAKIEKECCAYVASKGRRAYKLEEQGRRGWPDRTIILQAIFVEFKDPKTGKLRPDQVKRLEELKQFGEVWVIDDVEDFKAKYDVSVKDTKTGE